MSRSHSSTEQHQCQCYLQRLHPERLSKPTVYEADLDTPLAQPIRTPAEAFVRRLGWDNLKLDPEHLEERCIDALRQMGADYQIIDAPASSTDHVIIRARLNDEVELNILIAEDFAEGTYRITCTRVAGIVTAYHAGLRALRDTIGLTRELQRTGLYARVPLRIAQLFSIRAPPSPRMGSALAFNPGRDRGAPWHPKKHQGAKVIVLIEDGCAPPLGPLLGALYGAERGETPR
eukprot:CAMPEP_0181196170 /NCGR_PEP_ID=MMETSP1096-20121128/15303_1 /TAXON_ID=156174 ORGANISM="Chrysochromulina ericina, Strain CCMP281" /NCGR_SAMPLE_ID=MMETSP1096 /ASSEMBLY_ACC=CAM_ASM_000453 /LENGTH=232 /DNA_ID=CAMNT_0023285873 /DNA_START=138 /DNA_END=839 /DNA_ORIENTATION=+